MSVLPLSYAQQLAGLSLRPGQAAIWFLGQSTFLLQLGGTTVLVDPYLAPHPPVVDRIVGLGIPSER
jgi:hypothetical protein